MKSNLLTGGRRDLTQGSLHRTILGLAFPVMAVMALNSLYSLVNAFWLGKMEVGAREALAAVGPAAALTFIVVAFGMGFGSGGTALVAQYTGAGPREADRAAAQTMLILTISAAFLAAAMFLLAPQVLRILCTPPEVMPQAVAFLRITLIGVPFTAFNIAYGSSLRALGDTLTMVWVALGANVVNFLLSPLLIFGWGAVPALGIRGAACVSAASAMLTALACLVLLDRGRAGLRLAARDFRPHRPTILHILRIGLPAGISMSSNSIGFLVLQAMINSLGATVMGAFTIGSRLVEIFGVPASALAVSAASVVGQALGAGKPVLARRAVRVSVWMYALGMLLPYALIVIEGQAVARAFTRDAAIIDEAGRFFLLVPASNYFFNLLMVVMAAFYGSGHTRPVLVISLLRQWVFRVPIGLFLGFALGWGSVGVYWGLVIGNLVSAALAWWVFRTGEWARAVVHNDADARH